MNSRVHPKYKTKYRVTNWTEYDQALVQRGDLNLEAPDHTTLSRRSKGLNVKLVALQSKKPIHLIIDSTGLSIVGEGEWAAAKHGGRGMRGWRKMHIGVDRAGMIRAQVLTESSGDDARNGLKVTKKATGKLASVTGDAAYDTVAIYDQATSRGARVVVPQARMASVSGASRGPQHETGRFRRSPGSAARGGRRCRATIGRAWSRTPSLGTSPCWATSSTPGV